MKILAGSSNLPLAKNIAQKLQLPLIEVELTYFKNQERRVWVKDQVRGENICLVQSFSQPVDTYIIETLLLIDALERAGAKKIILIVPWMGYSLQDKVFRSGEPIAAKVVADILSNSHIKRIFLLDLHNSSIPAFFQVPTEHLSALELYVQHCQKNYDLGQAIVVSPDFGGLKKARNFAKKLQLPLANIDKQRDLNTGKVTATAVHGEVAGKIALIFDDVIMSGGTVIEAARILKSHGAKKVYFLATHGILCGEAKDKIAQSEIDQVIITNSIQQENLQKITTLDVTNIFVEALNSWL